MMKQTPSPEDYLLLSAYLDGQLKSSDTLKLEQRLAAEPYLATTLQDMRRNRYLMQQLKPRSLPRSFRLTEAMVQRRRKVDIYRRWLPVFSFSTALSALALVFLFFFYFMNGQSSMAAMPETMMAEDKAISISDAERAPGTGQIYGSDLESEVQLITWGEGTVGYAAHNEWNTAISAHQGIGGRGGGGDSVRSSPVMNSAPAGTRDGQLQGLQPSETAGGTAIVLLHVGDTQAPLAQPKVQAAGVDYTVINSGPILGIRLSNIAPEVISLPPDSSESMPVTTVPEWQSLLALGLAILFGLSLMGLLFFWLRMRNERQTRR